MLSANGVTVRFGKRVLFEDVNIKFENKDTTPFDKRKESEYNEYFRKLWGELDN